MLKLRDSLLIGMCLIAPLAGCKNSEDKLKEQIGIKKVMIYPGDTYSNFAKRLQNENPKLKREFDRRAIEDLLKDMNGYPAGNLPIGKEMKLPVY